MSQALVRRVIAVAVLIPLAGCGGGGGGGNNVVTPVTPTVNPTVTLVTVTPATLSARPGDPAQQLTATAAMSNSTTQTITSQAGWTSSADQVATVASSGLVTPRSAGEAEIRATYLGVSGTARITVTAAAPTGFSLSGRVREQGTATGISGVTVIVKDTPFTTVSDSSGNYAFAGLSAGNFVLRATKAGYQLTEVPVSLSANATVDISMPASVQAPVAAFVVIPDANTTATGEQCEVLAEGAANRLRCTFDGTRSSAPGGITAYRWAFPVSGQPDVTFSTSRVERPTLPCGTFGSTGVTADRAVTLTVTHAGGSTTVTRMITFRRNGPC